MSFHRGKQTLGRRSTPIILQYVSYTQFLGRPSAAFGSLRHPSVAFGIYRNPVVPSPAVLERAVLSLGTDRSSACVAALTSRTFHYRDDWTFKQDVGADCSNSCVARYLSTWRRAVQCRFASGPAYAPVIRRSTRYLVIPRVNFSTEVSVERDIRFWEH